MLTYFYIKYYLIVIIIEWKKIQKYLYDVADVKT